MMIVLLILGVFLVVAVLMQHGKSQGVSGTIVGGSDTYYGSDKGAKSDKLLARLTTVVGIVFVVIVLVAYIAQPDYGNFPTGAEWKNYSDYFSKFAEMK